MIRTLITALASSVMIGVFAVPVLLFSFLSKSDRLVTVSSAWWAKLVLTLTGVRLTVVGREYVSDGAARFFVGNHQGTLDIPILIAALGGGVRFMAKRGLFQIPVFGWMLERGRFVPIDRRDARRTLRTLQTMLDRLKHRPISYAVFPEGRRTEGGKLQPFRPGSLKVCKRSGLDIVPFTIDGSHRAYNHRTLRVTPGEVRVVFSAPISAEDARRMSVNQLCDVVREAVARPLSRSAPSYLGSDGSDGSSIVDLGAQRSGGPPPLDVGDAMTRGHRAEGESSSPPGPKEVGHPAEPRVGKPPVALDDCGNSPVCVEAMA